MATKKSTTKKPAKKPAAKKPAKAAKAVKKPAARKPAPKKPAKATKKPAVKKPAAKKPVAKKPAAKKPAKAVKAAKKPAAKKPAAKKPKVPPADPALLAAAKARKPPLAKSFLAQCRVALEADLARYSTQATSLEREADELTLNHEPGDVQFDEESGAGNSFAVERDQNLMLSKQAHAEMDEIEKAIERLDNGTYGICIISHKPISKERLRAIPHAAVRVEQKSHGATWR